MTDTTSPEPMTPEDEATLNALTQRKAAIVAAAAEEARTARLTALAPVITLLGAVKTDAVAAALDAAIASNPDPDTYGRLVRFQQIYNYDLGSIAQTVAALQTPVPTAAAAA